MQETNEALVAKIKAGIAISENMLHLWQQNSGFIALIANRYKGYEDIEDLKQQGYIGLCNAVEGYRAEENVPFINYVAFWIWQSMARYIDNCGSVVRIPSHEKQRHREYKKLLQDFKAQAGRGPTDWEMCRCMGISRKVLGEIKSNARMGQIGSLDAGIGEDGDNTVADMIPAEVDIESAVLDEMEKEELKQILWPMVDALPGFQPQVIRSLYQDEKTLKQTGETIGVTLERVRVIKQNALRELRRPGRIRRLRPFFPEPLVAMAYHHNGVEEFNRTWTSSTELVVLRVYEEITGHAMG